MQRRQFLQMLGTVGLFTLDFIRPNCYRSPTMIRPTHQFRAIFNGTAIPVREAMERLTLAAMEGEVDFIVTAPTRSVAIQFDARTMDAPVVVAKGINDMALQICKIATERLIPIVERQLLAEELFDKCVIGVSVNYYRLSNEQIQMKALVEVVRYVYALKGRDLDAEYKRAT